MEGKEATVIRKLDAITEITINILSTTFALSEKFPNALRAKSVKKIAKQMPPQNTQLPFIVLSSNFTVSCT